MTKWLSRLRPDPLKRLRLGDGQPTDMAELVALRAARSSLPEATPVQRARVDTSVRQVVDEVTYGMSRPWSAAVRSASVSRVEIPLEIRVTPLPGGADMVRAFFEPLGWDVALEPVQGAGRYVSLTLRGEQRVVDALSHLYVLIPALDADKHYWVGEDEIDKLLARNRIKRVSVMTDGELRGMVSRSDIVRAIAART